MRIDRIYPEIEEKQVDNLYTLDEIIDIETIFETLTRPEFKLSRKKCWLLATEIACSLKFKHIDISGNKLGEGNER